MNSHADVNLVRLRDHAALLCSSREGLHIEVAHHGEFYWVFVRGDRVGSGPLSYEDAWAYLNGAGAGFRAARKKWSV